MGLTDDLANLLIDIGESVGLDPVDLVDLIERGDDPTAIAAVLADQINPTDEIVALLIDFTEEFILSEATETGQLTPQNVEQVVDDVEGGAASVLGAVIALTAFLESISGDRFDETQSQILQAVTALGFEDVTGREVDATLQEGIDPALKQLVHSRHRSKQADFKDFADVNKAFRGSGQNIQPRAGIDAGDLPDYLNPRDIGWLPDPDTYGTIPEQQALYELAALEVSEPEELIEEPVQYGIPVPKLAIEQVTKLRGIPSDAADIYLEVIEQLPKTENLIQDYVRLTEFNFRLREQVQAGVITPQQAVDLIEPELRDIIEDALPEDRYREEDRTADETVDILVDELLRNFQLLDSLPADPPSEGDLEAWFQKGVITSQQYQNLYQRFGSIPEAFGFYLQESAIDVGWDGVQEQFALGRLSAQEARLRLRLIGFNQQEASRILSGADGDSIVTNRLVGEGEESQLPVSLATEIGEARGAQLTAVGIDSLSTLAETSVEQVAEITGMSDQQAQTAIESAQRILQQGQG
jgi:hypothetical protein